MFPQPLQQGRMATLRARTSTTTACRLTTRAPSSQSGLVYRLGLVRGRNLVRLRVRKDSRPGRWLIRVRCGSDRLALTVRVRGRQARGTALVDQRRPDPEFMMPFPCGEVWSSSTYAGHGNAVDWNLPGPEDGGQSVVASAGGRAWTAPLNRSNDGYGNYVIVNHADGWSTVYGHLRGYAVRSGDAVRSGQILGFVGTTGRSTANHLHYEQRFYRTVQRVQFSGGLITIGGSYR